MPANQFAGHDPTVLLIIILTGATVFLCCLVFLGSSWSQRGGAASALWRRTRDASVLCATAAVGLYVWGAGHLLVAGDSQFDACLAAVGRDKAGRVVGYEGDYVPLRLSCVMPNGDSYSAGVPAYVNPAIAALALVGLICAGFTCVDYFKGKSKSQPETGKP